MCALCSTLLCCTLRWASWCGVLRVHTMYWGTPLADQHIAVGVPLNLHPAHARPDGGNAGSPPLYLDQSPLPGLDAKCCASSTPQVLNLPSCLAYPLFYKLASATDASVPAEPLLRWMHAADFWGAPDSLRAFRILCQVREVWQGGLWAAQAFQHTNCFRGWWAGARRGSALSSPLHPFVGCVPGPGEAGKCIAVACWSCYLIEPSLAPRGGQEGSNHVTEQELRPVMAGILVSHPGLEFLQDAPEFQDRWVAGGHSTRPHVHPCA